MNPFLGVAAALVLGGQRAVVAMQLSISDQAAICFSEAVYRALAQGDPIEAAVTEGRIAVLNQHRSNGVAAVECFSPVLLKSAEPPPLPPPGWVLDLLVVLGILGGLAPGFLFFTPYAPPLFPPASLMAGLVGLMVLAPGLRRIIATGQGRPLPHQGLRLGTLIIVLSLFFGAGYMSLLRFTTVSPPGGWQASERIQVGFHMASWSLTPEALSFVEANPDLRSPQQLMLAFAVFESGETELIWRAWSIIGAGFVLIVCLVMNCLLWARGFGEIIRAVSSRITAEQTPIRQALESI